MVNDSNIGSSLTKPIFTSHEIQQSNAGNSHDSDATSVRSIASSAGSVMNLHVGNKGVTGKNSLYHYENDNYNFSATSDFNSNIHHVDPGNFDNSNSRSGSGSGGVNGYRTSETNPYDVLNDSDHRTKTDDTNDTLVDATKTTNTKWPSLGAVLNRSKMQEAFRNSPLKSSLNKVKTDKVKTANLPLEFFNIEEMEKEAKEAKPAKKRENSLSVAKIRDNVSSAFAMISSRSENTHERKSQSDSLLGKKPLESKTKKSAHSDTPRTSKPSEGKSSNKEKSISTLFSGLSNKIPRYDRNTQKKNPNIEEITETKNGGSNKELPPPPPVPPPRKKIQEIPQTQTHLSETENSNMFGGGIGSNENEDEVPDEQGDSSLHASRTNSLIGNDDNYKLDDGTSSSSSSRTPSINEKNNEEKPLPETTETTQTTQTIPITSTTTLQSNSNPHNTNETVTVIPHIPENHSNNNENNENNENENNNNNENNVSATTLKYANRLKNVLGKDVEIDNAKLEKALERLKLDAGDEISSKNLKKITKEIAPEYRLKTETKSNTDKLDGKVKKYKTVNVTLEKPTQATPEVQFRKVGNNTYTVFSLPDMKEITPVPDHLKSPSAYLKFLKKNAGADDVEFLYGQKKGSVNPSTYSTARRNGDEAQARGKAESKAGNAAREKNNQSEAVTHFTAAAKHYKDQADWLKKALFAARSDFKMDLRGDLLRAYRNWRDCAYAAKDYHQAIDACYIAKDMLRKLEPRVEQGSDLQADLHLEILHNANFEARCHVRRNGESKVGYENAEDCLKAALEYFKQWEKNGELADDKKKDKLVFETYIETLTNLRDCKFALQAGGSSAAPNPEVSALDVKLNRLQTEYNALHHVDVPDNSSSS